MIIQVADENKLMQSILGPTGSTGATGAIGATGPSQGPTGPTGPLGPTGSGTANVADVFLLKQGGDPDYTLALNRALATGLPVLFRYNGGTPYTLNATFAIPNNVVIYSDGPRALITKANNGNLFLLSGCTNATIKQLIISAGATTNNVINVTGSTNCLIEDVDIDSGTADGIIIQGTSTNITVRRGKGSNHGQHGVELHGAGVSRCTVTAREFQSNGGFGVILTGGVDSIGAGPFENEISFNRCYVNGLELIGITFECHNNRVIGNHAEGTGDNGISITGYQNVCVGNECVGNAHSGIHLYGRENVCAGNFCKNNGQEALISGSTAWMGIALSPAFGGASRANVVSGNTCVDDQAVPTQGYGVHATSASYTTWATGVLTALRTYMISGLNVYVATSAGTTGASPPIHTSGTVSDGGVNWLYLFGAAEVNETSLGASNNSVTGNTTRGNSQFQERDDSQCANSFMTGNNSPFRGFKNIGPVGNVNGILGDVIFRTRPANPYLAIYINAGSPTVPSSTVWYSLQPRAFNSTGGRPGGISGLGAGFEGAQFWDTTKNQFQIAPGAAYGGGKWADALGRQDPLLAAATAGSTQNDAVALSFQNTQFTTSNPGEGALLPPITFGNMQMIVRNDSANAIKVYPQSGAAINQLGTNGAITINPNDEMRFTSWSATLWSAK